MTIDLVTSHRHYLEHLRPVWEAMGDARGQAYVEGSLLGELPGSLPLQAVTPNGAPTLVAGLDDIQAAAGRRCILMEHGCGQSYGGDAISAGHAAYAGGSGRQGIIGFICPNDYSADRNRAANPDAFVTVVGSPRLQHLQTLPAPAPSNPPVVALSFHWECTVVRETMSGWRHWYSALVDLARRDDMILLGHAHPRAFPVLSSTYRKLGIEPVASFEEILQRAHVYCCDNSSTMYEFAAVRGPVVVLDAPWYRPNIHHGLRFWDAADIGPRIIEPTALPIAIASALTRDPWPEAEPILARVFPPIADPASEAAAAVIHAATLADGTKPRPALRFPRTAPWTGR